MDAVKLDKVNKSFGRISAVRDLSVSVPEGSVYGFLGPNGAGKTTTIRMIMDIIRPDSGSIQVLGHDSRTLNKERVGYMPEERGLYRKMRSREVLAYFASIKGVSGIRLKEQVASWLDRVQLTDAAEKRVEELSRGMHQKLQFAVTAINDPDLLILDEPFSGLDPLNMDLIKGIILEMQSAGKTVIFSTHAMHEAERLCDAIVLINQGQVVLDGPLRDIRQAQSTHAVILETEPDFTLPDEIPGVEAVRCESDQYHLILKTGTDTQDVLRFLTQQIRLRSFEVNVPSLHEIFVEQVSKSNAKNH